MIFIILLILQLCDYIFDKVVNTQFLHSEYKVENTQFFHK